MSSLKKRKLGSSDIELPVLTMGTWGLCGESYGRVFAEQRLATLSRAISDGITSFDMAPSWGADGASERAVAEAVGERRSEMTYITRVGLTIGPDGLNWGFGADEMRAQVEASLKRLNTDYIDVLLLQHPSIATLARDEVRATLEALVAEGKARTWGLSTSEVEDARAGLILGARVLCTPFNMLQPNIVWDLTSECQERGVGVLARSPLLHGMLSGRWGEKKRFTPEDHRMYRWSYEALEARVKQARDRRKQVGPDAPSMSVVALQFILAHDIVSSILIGPRTPSQVVGAIEDAAYELGLTVSALQASHDSAI